MKLLLDTHVWLWMVLEPERLARKARKALEDRDNALYFSAASGWELAIKYALGKLPLPFPPDEFVAPRLLRDGVAPLPVDLAHALAVARLPPHHTDPFDRMLIAQALAEGLTIVTVDAKFGAYGAPLLRGA